MNETERELDLIRTQLRAGIERDLRQRGRRSRLTHRWSFRIAIPTLAVLASATAAIVLALIVSAASPSSASAASRRALRKRGESQLTAEPWRRLASTLIQAGLLTSSPRSRGDAETRWRKARPLRSRRERRSRRRSFVFSGGDFVS